MPAPRRCDGCEQPETVVLAYQYCRVRSQSPDEGQTVLIGCCLLLVKRIAAPRFIDNSGSELLTAQLFHDNGLLLSLLLIGVDRYHSLSPCIAQHPTADATHHAIAERRRGNGRRRLR